MAASQTALVVMVTLSALLLGTGAVSQTITVNGKNFFVDFDTGNDMDWAAAQSACQATTGSTLAVFDSAYEYEEFIDKLLTAIGTDNDYNGKYWLGIKKAAGSRYVTGAEEGRPVGFSNFHRHSFSAGDPGCISLNFLRDPGASDFSQFANSNWVVEDCDDILDGFICMDTAEPECTDPEDRCNGPTTDRDPDEKVCLWSPYPNKVFTYLMGYKMCAAGGGHYPDLLDPSDITRLENMGLVNPSQSWNQYWLGLLQKPGQGVPRWSNNYINDVPNWEDPPHYGSSLNSVPKAGLYNAKARTFNLFQIAPFVEFVSAGVSGLDDGNRLNREAFVICEATQAKFCLAYSPDVANADKSSPCCDKVVYTCKPGYVFVDGEVTKKFDCSCDLQEVKYLDVKDCIVKDPCWDGSVTCGLHSVCTFTNEIQRPYKCKCKPGYEKGSHGHCRDINECYGGTNPCTSYYSTCINTPGSYTCQCTKGYGWDGTGKCSVIETISTMTMTLYFSVIMDYSADMNNPSSAIYGSLKSALDNLMLAVYGPRVKVESFVVTADGLGRIKIKVVLYLYTTVQIGELSALAWSFHRYILSGTHVFTVGTNTYAYTGGVYLTAPSLGQDIPIQSLCSLYENTNYCNGSPCRPERDYPVCVCQDGYTGVNCAEHKKPLEPLSPVEIGLVSAVVLLSLLVICILCFVCCIWCGPRWRGGRRFTRGPPEEKYAPGPYMVKPQYGYAQQAAFRRPFKLFSAY